MKALALALAWSLVRPSPELAAALVGTLVALEAARVSWRYL